MLIIMKEHGTGQEIVDVTKIQIPDLWHIANRPETKDEWGERHDPQIDALEQARILECWYLCHDLLLALRSINREVHFKHPIDVIELLEQEAREKGIGVSDDEDES